MKPYVIVSNGRWRRWVFEPSDFNRAQKFSKKFDLTLESVYEIPFSAGYTVWVGKEDHAFSEPVVITQRPLNLNELFV